MANTFGVILFIIGVLVIMTLFRGGTDELKSEPIQSTIKSGQESFDVGKKVVNWGIDTYKGVQSEEEDVNKTLIEIGQIPCANDEDCNLLEECYLNNICLCQGGSCWREE